MTAVLRLDAAIVDEIRAVFGLDVFAEGFGKRMGLVAWATGMVELAVRQRVFSSVAAIRFSLRYVFCTNVFTEGFRKCM